MVNQENYLSFKVYGLDCVEEVSIIKKVLTKNVHEDSLEFDLLNGKLRIKSDDTNLTAKTVVV